MIFNNFVDTGTPLTASIWNEAWGYAGTASSMYDAVGAQQDASQIYSARLYANSKQSLTVATPKPFTVVQFDFATAPAYPSYSRSGSLMNWIENMPTSENFRDGITIQRTGFYIIQADISVGDSSNRICSSTNADGINVVPDRFVNAKIESDLSVLMIYSVMPNSIKAATAAATQNVQPFVSSSQTFLAHMEKGERITLQAECVDCGARGDKIVYASLKVFLMKAADENL